MSLGNDVAKSAGWTLAMRMSTRIIGLASTLILARLLVPADFGLIAMGTSILAALEATTAVGLEWAIIQRQTQERAHLDSAWTLNLCIGVLKAALLLALAPVAIAIYHEPRVASIMGVLAFTAFFGGFRNIGVVLHEQALRFKRIFALGLISKLSSFAVTVGLAFYWQSFWALLFGMLTRSVVDVLLSYVLFSYRPRLTLSHAKDFFHFSKWVTGNSILFFIQQRGTDFIVGNRAGPAALGAYNIAYEVSSLPTTELTYPLMRAVFPGYSRLQGDKPRLADGFITVFQLVAVLSLPVAAGLSCLADLFVMVMLGPKWVSVIPLMAPLAVYGAIRSLQATFGTTYLALGQQHLSAKLMALYIVLAFPMFAFLLTHYNLTIATWGLTGIYIVTGALNIWLLRTYLDLRGMRVVGALFRPVAASLLMTGALLALRGTGYWQPVSTGSQLAMLLALIVAGAIVYTVSLLLLWHLGGREDGAEARLLRIVGGFLRENHWRTRRQT